MYFFFKKLKSCVFCQFHDTFYFCAIMTNGLNFSVKKEGGKVLHFFEKKFRRKIFLLRRASKN